MADVMFDQLITDLDADNVKRLNAYQDPFGSAWLNVVPSKNLGLKLTDQQLRISLSLRLGAKICEKHTCRCGKLVEENGHHGISCTRSAGRFSRHHQGYRDSTFSGLSLENIVLSLGLASRLDS